MSEKLRREEKWTYKEFTLASGNVGYQGAVACLNSAGKVEPASEQPGLLPIGTFYKTVDASDGDATCTVRFFDEVTIERLANATADDACAADDVGALAYLTDDRTVSPVPTGRSPIGRIWEVSTTKGVAVQPFDFPAAIDGGLVVGEMPDHVSDDFILPAGSVVHDAVYDVPETDDVSTVTLPAAAPSGTRITFVADGVKNGHTVQYRDATGPTNLTTALTASKRHVVTAIKLGAAWHCAAYVAP